MEVEDFELNDRSTQLAAYAKTLLYSWWLSMSRLNYYYRVGYALSSQRRVSWASNYPHLARGLAGPRIVENARYERVNTHARKDKVHGICFSRSAMFLGHPSQVAAIRETKSK